MIPQLAELFPDTSGRDIKGLAKLVAKWMRGGKGRHGVTVRCGERLPRRDFGADIHALIETARHSHEDDEIREFVYEKRVLAETMISRPVMKGGKVMVRMGVMVE